MFPNWPHLYCLFHIKNNIRSRFSGNYNNETREKLLDIFTKCAYVYRVSSFNRFMKELKEVSGGDIEDFLKDLPSKYLANAFFPSKRYGELCSNVADSFNSCCYGRERCPLHSCLTGSVSKSWN